MPDARLERTRNPKPAVPACIRLGHEWSFDPYSRLSHCIRCRVFELRAMGRGIPARLPGWDYDGKPLAFSVDSVSVCDCGALDANSVRFGCRCADWCASKKTNGKT